MANRWEDDPEVQSELEDLIVKDAPLLGFVEKDVRADELAARQSSPSLQLAGCSSADLRWHDRSRWQKPRQLRAQVRVAGATEDLAATDPWMEGLMARRQDATLERCLLTIGQSEPYAKDDGELWCSKLIAVALPLR
jgi:putative nucleic acid modification protein with dual OB domain